MTAFAGMIDALFENRDEASDATYYATSSGSGVAVRVVQTDVEVAASLFRTDAIVSGKQIDVRVSQVASQPLEGARFEIASVKFYVRTSRRDEKDLVWECDVDQRTS